MFKFRKGSEYERNGIELLGDKTEAGNWSAI